MAKQYAASRVKEKECFQFLVFSEDNSCYELFSTCISILCLISSYIYLYLATFRNNITDENANAYILIECCFLIHMLLQFFKSYRASDEHSTMQKEIRSISMISLNYLRTYFLVDLIPLMPLQYYPLPNNQ